MTSLDDEIREAMYRAISKRVQTEFEVMFPAPPISEDILTLDSLLQAQASMPPPFKKTFVWYCSVCGSSTRDDLVCLWCGHKIESGAVGVVLVYDRAWHDQHAKLLEAFPFETPP